MVTNAKNTPKARKVKAAKIIHEAFQGLHESAASVQTEPATAQAPPFAGGSRSKKAKTTVKVKPNGGTAPAPNGAGNGIAKPTKFSLKDFATEQNPKATGINPTCAALPLYRLSEVKDFFILHPSDDYWSIEIALVQVPTPGSKESTQHLILDGIVKKYSTKLQQRVKYCQIVLGAKPDNIFFFALLPTRNPDNSFNAAAIRAATQAKSGIWTTVTSRKAEGHDDYMVGQAEDDGAFLYIRDAMAELFFGRNRRGHFW